MDNLTPITVLGHGGLSGVLLDPLPLPPGRDRVRLSMQDGRLIEVPIEMLSEQPDGTYRIQVGPEDLDEDRCQPVTSLPVIDEELVLGRRSVRTGGLRIHKEIIERREGVDIPLHKERVEVRHVRIDRDIDKPMSVRHDGDTTIIPIMEEVLIVEKRLRLIEEIHVTRIKTEERHREEVTLHREEARIERIDEHGHAKPIDEASPREAGGSRNSIRRPRRKTILGD